MVISANVGRYLNTFRWNFGVLVINGAFFHLGLAFYDPSTILPALVSTLTGSSLLVGLIAAIQSGGWFLPQLFAAGFVEGRERVKPLIIPTALIGRVSIGVMTLLLLFPKNAGEISIAAVLLATYALFAFSDGFTGVPWADIVAKTIDARKRGYLLGSTQFLGGILGFIGGLVVRHILADPSLTFPRNYGLLFLFAFIAFTLSLVFLLNVREPAQTGGASRQGFKRFVRSLPKRMENRMFRRMMLVRWLVGWGGMALPFYVVYAREVFLVPAAMVGVFVSAQVTGRVIASLGWGYLGDKKGNRVIIQITALLALAMPISVIFLRAMSAGWATYGFLLVFAFMGANFGGAWIGFTNYILEVAPAGERPAYIGLMNTLSGPLAIAPLLGGVVVRYTSYEALFALAALFALTGLLVSLTLKEPRQSSTPSEG